MKLSNEVVVVTGANRGLGRAFVQVALEAGAAKVYAGARDPKQLDDLVARGEGRVVALALDVTSDASLEAAAAKAADATVLVNNAGVLAGFSVLSTSAADLQRDFAVNTFGTLAATKAFLPALERAAKAAIVNVLSVVSFGSIPGLGGYSAAKAASYSMTQALRSELGKKGIAVQPGSQARGEPKTRFPVVMAIGIGKQVVHGGAPRMALTLAPGPGRHLDLHQQRASHGFSAPAAGNARAPLTD